MSGMACIREIGPTASGPGAFAAGAGRELGGGRKASDAAKGS
jgi:hypothetical protein